MIHLPWPPSTNALWRAVKGRNIKSAHYRAWQLEAGWQLNATPVTPVTEPYHLEIVLNRPDKRRRDVSNYAKAIEDLLVEHEITPDDSLAQSVTIRWADAVEGPVVKVEAG